MNHRNTIPKATIRLLCALLIVSLFAVPVTAADETGYSDDLWSNGSYTTTIGGMAARRLYVYGLIENQRELANKSSDSDLEFCEDEPIGRLDAAQLLYNICGGSTSGSCPFSDVPNEYRDAVSWLYEIGVVKGIGNGLFGTGSITEVHFLIMLSRFLGWMTEERDQLYSRALQEGILPICHSENGFCAGDLYQMVIPFLERYGPDKCKPVRTLIGRPTELRLYADSCEDANRQIRAAIAFLPTRITVSFPDNCPQEDIQEFCQLYNWSAFCRPFPLICQVDLKRRVPCTLSAESDLEYTITISGYAQAHIAEVSRSDWLRVYRDMEYRNTLLRFREEQITPLLAACDSDYTRALAAHNLLVELTSYDYGTYNSIINQTHGANEASHRILGFIQNRSLVCDGYSNVYQWLLLQFGIDSYVVIGIGEDLCHSWNKVRIHEKWYNTDTCWNDNGLTMDDFLKSDRYFTNYGHVFTDSYSATLYPSPDNY